MKTSPNCEAVLKNKLSSTFCIKNAKHGRQHTDIDTRVCVFFKLILTYDLYLNHIAVQPVLTLLVKGQNKTLCGGSMTTTYGAATATGVDLAT